MLDRNSALAELRCATSCFETVLLRLAERKTLDISGFLRVAALDLTRNLTHVLRRCNERSWTESTIYHRQ